MYLHQELREVNQYRQTEALQRISSLHKLMAANAGFIRSLACRDPGRVGHYAWFRFWETAQDHAAFRETDVSKQFAATRQDGLYWQLPGGVVAEGHWQSVTLTAAALDTGRYLLRFAFSVSRDLEEEFLGHQARFLELVAQAPGLSLGVTLAGTEAGDERSYLTLVRAATVDSYREFLESGPAAAWRATTAESSYRTLARDCYEVVEEVQPK